MLPSVLHRNSLAVFKSSHSVDRECVFSFPVWGEVSAWLGEVSKGLSSLPCSEQHLNPRKQIPAELVSPFLTRGLSFCSLQMGWNCATRTLCDLLSQIDWCAIWKCSLMTFMLPCFSPLKLIHKDKIKAFCLFLGFTCHNRCMVKTYDQPTGRCSNWIPVRSGSLGLRLDDSCTGKRHQWAKHKRSHSKVGGLTVCQPAEQRGQRTW